MKSASLSIPLLIATLLSITAQQSYAMSANDSLAVLSILRANGVDSIYVCGVEEDLFPSGPCYVPACVESLVVVRNGRVVSLHLENQLRLGGLARPFIGKEIGQITELESLFVEANNIDSLPAELSTLTKLKWLNLLGNPFTIFPTVIGNCTSLEYLDISSARFAVLPPEIGRLTKLKQLYIGSGWLTGIPAEIGALSNLEVLDIPGARLMVSLPSQIGNLKKLRWLRLMFCSLTALPEEIGNLGELDYLDLLNNKLLNLPSTIGKLANLTTLSLSNNQLSALPDSIGSLKRLRKIFADRNLLTTLPKSFGNLDSLIQCSLNGNNIVEIPSTINGCISLRTLNLDDNELTNLPRTITSMESLGFSLLGNRLCKVDSLVAEYLDNGHTGADWRATQQCSNSFVIKPVRCQTYSLLASNSTNAVNLLGRTVMNKDVAGRKSFMGWLIHYRKGNVNDSYSTTIIHRR